MNRSRGKSFMLLLYGALGFLLLFLACRKEEPGKPLGKLIVPIGFPAVQFPEDNQYSEDRWQLGKKLFFDKRLSIDSSTSCASCHRPELSFAHNLPTTSGAFDRPGIRNAPSLANVAYHPYMLREGSVPTLEMQALVPIQEQNEFAHNIVAISEELKADSSYKEMSQKAYERAPDPFVITRALGVFQRSLLSGNSPYDTYRFQGRKESLDVNQVRGMELFFSDKTSCYSCHSGFNFTNYAFENTGLSENYNDPGRFRFTLLESDRARFKVPSLRNVAMTAPYMHNGVLTTLEEVLEHYNLGGENHPNKSYLIRPLGLSDQEKEDLIAFLNSLTDVQFLHDPRWNTSL